eukprot:2086667-Pleurochrysis_carterae.AAC.2
MTMGARVDSRARFRYVKHSMSSMWTWRQPSRRSLRHFMRAASLSSAPTLLLSLSLSITASMPVCQSLPVPAPSLSARRSLAPDRARSKHKLDARSLTRGGREHVQPQRRVETGTNQAGREDERTQAFACASARWKGVGGAASELLSGAKQARRAARSCGWSKVAASACLRLTDSARRRDSAHARAPRRRRARLAPARRCLHAPADGAEDASLPGVHGQWTREALESRAARGGPLRTLVDVFVDHLVDL